MSKLNDFDQIVNKLISKSVVAAPSNPNGGAALPAQASKEKGKKKAGQYEANFDRGVGESEDQLDDWLKETDEIVGDDFMNDDDAGEEYDPIAGDDGLSKSNKAEEDEEDMEEDDIDPEEDEKETKKKPPMKPKEEKEKDRKREVRKALGKDSADFVDASPMVKSLVDAIMDWREEAITETRALHSRINQLEKALRTESRQMTKSLAVGMSQLKVSAGPIETGIYTESQHFPDLQPMQPMRKGYGMQSVTTQKYEQGFDLAKSLDVLDAAFKDPSTGVTSRDCTILENDRSPQNLSNSALAVLKKNGCL